MKRLILSWNGEDVQSILPESPNEQILGFNHLDTEQGIRKFPDKSKGGGSASVAGGMQVAWYPSGQQSTERLDPT